MKDFYKILFSIISIIIALSITIYSHDDTLLILLVPLFLTGVAIPLNVALFKKGNFKTIFVESLKYSFLISSLIYMSGYTFFALKPLFF
ncbi:MAG: hypothetical protein RSF34_20715 [Flavobacterium sp.]|uniref:hypothetical protein n=1 Tax=Flavobacterium sp. TaxID=239 RepID=UPI002FC6E594